MASGRIRIGHTIGVYSLVAEQGQYSLSGQAATLLYSAALYVPTHYVTVTALGGGDGSLLNPWTLAEAVAQATVGNKVKLGPGVYSVVAGHPSTGTTRDPRLVFIGNGTAGNPIVFFAETPAILATNDAQKTIIRALSGTGAIIGNGPNTNSGGDHVILDGIQIEVGGTYDSIDTGDMIVNWRTTGQKLLRCIIDEAGHAPPGTRNWGGYYTQNATGWEVADCIFRNQVLSGSSNHSSLELYSPDTWEVHHCLFDSVNNCVHIKGDPDNTNMSPGSVHHCHMRNSYNMMEIGRINEIDTTNPVDIYQNIFEGNVRMRWRAYAATSPRNVRFVNNLFYNTTGTGGGNSGLHFYTEVGGASSYNSIIWRNNIYSVGSGLSAVYGGDIAVADVERMDFDYNIYHSMPNIKLGVDFNTWRSTHGNDPNGSNANPLLDANLKLQVGSPGINFGRDYLNLLGGGTSAVINAGPFILPGQVDVIGIRT